MNQSVYEVVLSRLHAEELTIQRVRQSGYRVPISDNGACERVNDCVPVQAGLDLSIFNDELGIIVENKIVASHRPVDAHCKNGQQKPDP